MGYLCTEDAKGQVQMAILAARSHIALKRQLSIPELCAALTGAQLAAVLKKELNLEIHDFILDRFHHSPGLTSVSLVSTRCLLEQGFPKSKDSQIHNPGTMLTHKIIRQMISPGERLCLSSRDAIAEVKALISCGNIHHYGQSNLTMLFLTTQKKCGNLPSVV